jgi:hypothetical protein
VTIDDPETSLTDCFMCDLSPLMVDNFFVVVTDYELRNMMLLRQQDWMFLFEG